MNRVWAAAFAVGCVVGLFSLVGNALAQGACNMDLRNAYGPFDYRTATPDQKDIVERNHFTGTVETLTAGVSGTLGGDISYTLRVFPNHARALMAMSRLARREKRPVPNGARYPPECWFQRAIAFQPEDPEVRLVYGIELLRDNKRSDAIEQLSLAEKLSGPSPNVYYNLGLAYFDLGDFAKSLDYAQRAYALGHPLPGLRQKLEAAGRWRD